MGTKVHSKSFLPGYYTMRDINGDVNGGSWPLCYEGETSRSGHYCNGFLPRPAMDGCLGYNKEVLKQTMLEHETVFRNQVYELHRLYRIQKDLMDEMKQKNLQKYSMPVETSQPNFFSSQMQFGHVQKMWNIPSLPLLPSTCNRASVSGTDNIRSPLSFVEASPVTDQNSGSSKACELLESKCKKSWKRLFDLQLPADEYIDSEEQERFEEGKHSEVTEVASCPRESSEVAPEIEVNLSLGSGVNPGWQGEASRSNSCSRIRGLADLNEPVQIEEPMTSASVGSLGQFKFHRENQQQDPSKLDLGFQDHYREFFPTTQNKGNDGPQPNQLQLWHKEKKHEWLSCNFESGKCRSKLYSFPQGSSPEKLPPSSQPLHRELMKAHELPCPPSDQSKRVPAKERKIFGLEVSERIHDLTNYNHSRAILASQKPLFNKSDITKSDSSLVSSWKKPVSSLSQNPIAVQALPSFNNSGQLSMNSKSSIQVSGLAEDRWHLSDNSSSIPSLGSEKSYRNGLHHGYQSECKMSQVCFPSLGFDYMKSSNGGNSTFDHDLQHGPTKFFKGSDCMDAKSADDMNLNILPPSSFHSDMAPQQDLVSTGIKRKHEDLPVGLSWLRVDPNCNGKPEKGRGSSTKIGLDFLNGCPLQLTNKIEIGENYPILLKDSTSTTCASDGEPKSINASNCSNIRNILGFPLFDKPCREQSYSLTSMPISHNQSEVVNFVNDGKVGILDIDLACDPMPFKSEKQITTVNIVTEGGLDSNLAIPKNHINLNECISEEGSPSSPYHPLAIVKIAAQVDAPVVPETEEVIPHETLQSPQHDARDSQEELVRIAVEAIISISSSGVHYSSDDAISYPSEVSLRDCLLWFADVVSSDMGDPESEVGLDLRGRDDGDHVEFSCDGLDYFESMTLKLTETKIEECWCKPQVPETRKEEDTAVTLLLSRPRKGQARRGRQRKDFQRDILPGLASLSRHEVTEDLQAIGGLMKATGHPWETGLTRRNATRNGWARGRRRTCGPIPSVSATAVYTMPRHQPNNSELGLEERSLTGWGKTTRRPRRQRCAAVIPPVPLGKV